MGTDLNEPTEVGTPTEVSQPPLGLLMSMALRSDHALGCPGYYDEMTLGQTVGVTHAQRLENTLIEMKRLWEEVLGRGFYRPEKEQSYAELAEKAGDGLSRLKAELQH